jgi:hypothetical protein
MANTKSKGLAYPNPIAPNHKGRQTSSGCEKTSISIKNRKKQTLNLVSGALFSLPFFKRLVQSKKS